MHRQTEITYTERDHSNTKIVSGEEILKIERERYTFFVYSSYLLINTLLAIFIIVNFLQGNTVIMYVEIAALASSLISTFLLGKYKKKQRIELVTIVMLQLLFSFLLFQSHGAAIWYVTLPAIGFFILGQKKGLICTVISFLLLLSMFIYDYYQISPIFELDFKLRLLFVYITLSFMIFLFEHSRHNSSVNMLKMADAIKTNEQRLQTILSTSRPIIFAINKDRKIDILEGESLKEIGLFAGAYKGYDITEAFGEDEGLLQCIENSLSGEFMQREITIKSSTFDIAFSPWKSPNNEIVGVIGMALDITEKRGIQKQLETSRKMEAIGKLAGGVAHDFNNMLGAISGYAELIQKKFGDGEDGKLTKYSNNILSAAQHSSDLVYKLLAFSRQKVFQKGPVDIHESIQDTVELMRDTLGNGISVNTSFNAESHIIIGDKSQIHNALLNLSVNSRDAMPDGGELSFQTDMFFIDDEHLKDKPYKVPVGNYIRISVSDNGNGMTSEVQNKIFEPFFTTKEQGKGTGLGLASVYGSIKSHGGTIDVTSELNKGTTFQIFLPIKLNRDNSLKSDIESKDELDATKNIMVIEDEDIVREVLCVTLKELKYNPISFADPLKAIEYYKENYPKIELIIVDIAMPQMSGHQCFRRLMEINKESKIIMASGYAINDEIRNTINEGAKDFIHKPYTAKNIATIMEKYLK